MTYTLIPGESCTASEEETMSTIRSILTEDTTVPKSRKRRVGQAAAAPVAVPQDAQPEAQRAFVERAPEKTLRRRATDLPTLQIAAPVAPRDTLASRVAASANRPLAAVRGFQPTTRHLALASAALLFVVRPHWFVIGAVIGLLVIIGAFMTFGADRIWQGVLNWLDRVEARNPKRAAKLRKRFDGFAYRWDGILDIFPEGMVDGLYMPDFQAMKQAEADHDAAVSDRLSRMVQES